MSIDALPPGFSALSVFRIVSPSVSLNFLIRDIASSWKSSAP